MRFFIFGGDFVSGIGGISVLLLRGDKLACNDEVVESQGCLHCVIARE